MALLTLAGVAAMAVVALLFFGFSQELALGRPGGTAYLAWALCGKALAVFAAFAAFAAWLMHSTIGRERRVRGELEECGRAALAQEREYREALLQNAIASYEVNYTRDRFVRGCDRWGDPAKGERAGTYSGMILRIARETVMEEDREPFLQTFSLENVREAWRQGRTEISMEYRQAADSGDCIWVLNSLCLLEDPCTRELYGISYVKNIDRQKRQEMTLRYLAERDSLSGLYNKRTTERLIDEYLDGVESRKGLHALLIVDIDNFKEVNDSLGHASGDELLEQISQELKKVFRTTDIVGRVGGDEFIAFLKNVSTRDAALRKADEICRALSWRTKSLALERPVTASVGVSFCPADGTNFQTLYRLADAALYDAKSSGKDTVSFFEGYGAERGRD